VGKFSKTMAFMGLISPVTASALGVGEIKLHSALNQILKADIPLTASSSESASEVRVNLASPSAFARAGLDRPVYLSRLRFSPVKQGKRLVIKVTSRDVIREPFLNFLVEVNWPQGKMLREFTVLLDPPATYQKKVNPVISTPKTASGTVTKSRYAVDSPSNYGFNKTPVNNSQAVSASNQPKDSVYSRRNDTLWGVAERAKSDSSISQEQMMIALYEANPRAFFKKNVNALKADHRLKIPSRDKILKYSRREALAEFRRQNDQWAGKVESASVADNKKSSGVKSKQVSVVQTTPDSQLKLVSPAEGETVGKTASASSTVNEPAQADLAMEMAETVSQENDELKARLKQVEQQLAMMQKMLTLKNKQLAGIGSNPSDLSGVEGDEKFIDLENTEVNVNEAAIDSEESAQEVVSNEAESTLIEPDLGAITEVGENVPDLAAEGIESLNLEQEPTELSSVDNVDTGMELADSSEAAQATESKAITPQSDLEDAVPANNQPVAAKSIPKATPVPEPLPEEESWLTELLSEPFYLAAAGGGVVLLIIMAWLYTRRRDNMAMIETESILSAPDTIKNVEDKEDVADETPDTSSNDIGAVAESSFLSEFTPSDFDALEAEHDDVDPISEADVYLAYGRYQQAEDLIRSAIENYPERDECKLKLLEIHYATEDKESFESYAQELAGMKSNNPEFWAKIVEMGRELCPQCTLFGDGGQIITKTGVDLADEDSSGSSVLGADESGSSESGEQNALDSLAPDLGFDVETSSESEDDIESVTKLLDSETAETEILDQETPLEFSFDPQEDNEMPEVIAVDSELDEINLDFSEELSSEDNSIGEMTELDSSGGNETLEFDLDFTASSEQSESAETDGLGLSDMNEIETKLDLAKAYVEMDDQTSARDILSEILAEGNDEQKTEAQALVEVLENKA